MAYRDHTKVVKVGNVLIGGGNPIAIQSMTNTRTEDVNATVQQILRLGRLFPKHRGRQLLRGQDGGMIRHLTVVQHPGDLPFGRKIGKTVKLRERIDAVVSCAKEHGTPIRVGVNSGSLEKNLVEKYGGVTPEGLVESALDKVHMVERAGFDQIVISIKSSDVLTAVKAHELLAQKTDYPLHVGITEAGTVYGGNIKSAIGLGIILYEGIGDTIRVSLSGDPVEEVRTARQILRDLKLRTGGVEVTSCPTCGRTRIDLIGLANKVEKMVEKYPYNIKVAVMGCAVNGPGEAKEADIGIAGGDGEGLLIKKGQIVRKVPEDELLSVLKDELDHWQS